VHPGGGLPGVVTSAKVIEKMVIRDFPSGTASQLPVDDIIARSAA